jgi:hypothetical protein
MPGGAVYCFKGFNQTCTYERNPKLLILADIGFVRMDVTSFQLKLDAKD